MPSVLAVLGLCLPLLAFVTTVSHPPRVCQIWLTHSICMYNGKSQRDWKTQLMFSSPSIVPSTIILDDKEVFLFEKTLGPLRP